MLPREHRAGDCAQIAVLAIGSCQFLLGSSRKLGNDAPQQSASDLQRGFFPRGKGTPGEEHGGHGGLLHRNRLEVVSKDSRLLELLRRSGDAVGGFGEGAHGLSRCFQCTCPARQRFCDVVIYGLEQPSPSSHLIDMQFFRTLWQFLVAVQLLPALEGGEGEETLVGGQAVLEGVMMRSPHAWAITCRKPSGELSTHSEPLERLSEKHPWMAWPVLRGVMTLGHAMTLGFRALKFSANVQLDELQKDEAGNAPEKKFEISGWIATVNILFSVGFFIFMYKYLPLLATTELKKGHPSLNGQIMFNLIDGLIRLALFLLFIWGTSLLGDIRRVYQYHGAEHKTVFAFENGDPLETAAVQKYSTFHPRCGTSFLMTVMIISIFVYMLVPVHTFWARFAIRIALLPVITGVAYEIIRFAAKHRGSLFAVMTAPGLWLQRVTTKPPSDEQAECAIHALDQAMALEKQRGGELVIA